MNTKLQTSRKESYFLVNLGSFNAKMIVMIRRITDFFKQDSSLNTLLWMGLGLRVLVFLVMNPQNPDAHHEVLEYILRRHRLPRTHELFLACHPPLYYLTSLPFYVLGGLKLVQFYGLITSSLNLWLMAKLVRITIKDVFIRNLSFVLATFLGTYVIYSLFVSNDTLSVLMGTWFFYNLIQYLRNQTIKNEIILSLSTGLALLTKTTFLPFIPVVLVIIVLVRIRQSFKKTVYALLLSGLIIGVSGTYKFVENFHAHHQFLIHNLDMFPLPTNATFYQGPQSWYNFNLLTLIKDPNLSSRNPSMHSAPLLMYGTFWYKHVYFENNLGFGNCTKFRFIGSTLFVVGILPTLLILMGIALLVRQGFLLLFKWKNEFGSTIFWENLFKVTCVVLLLGSVATMFTGIIKYNDWAFMHVRLLVHVFFPIVLALATGLEFLKKYQPTFLKYIALNLTIFAVLSIIYFSVESSIIAWNWLYFGDKDYLEWYSDKSLGL
jgi:branched-subunit amino acid transport protein AzlD